MSTAATDTGHEQVGDAGWPGEVLTGRAVARHAGVGRSKRPVGMDRRVLDLSDTDGLLDLRDSLDLLLVTLDAGDGGTDDAVDEVLTALQRVTPLPLASFPR
jgi:hypothetical protein